MEKHNHLLGFLTLQKHYEQVTAARSHQWTGNHGKV